MKKYLICLSAALLLGGNMLSAAVSERLITPDSPYRSLSVEKGITLIVSPQYDHVRVVADAEYIHEVIVEVHQGTLQVSYTDGEWKKRFPKWSIKVYVPAIAYEKIRASSGVKLNFEQGIVSDNVSFELSNGVTARGKVEAASVSILAASGVNVKISGKTDELTLEATAGASVHAFELVARKVKCVTEKGAVAKVTALEKLNARASAGSVIRYKGNPATSIDKSKGASVSQSK